MSVFEVKWSEESKKVGPNTLQRLLLAKLRLFWKRWFCCFLPQISANHFFRKLLISQKVSIVEHWDQLFWIPRIILHQKHPLLTKKKLFFDFLTSKWLFHFFCHNYHIRPIYTSTSRVLNICCMSWVDFFYFLYIKK